MVKKFTVEKSTISTNGGYVNTLVSETKIKVFGVEKTTKHRLLLKTDEEIAKGTVDSIELNDYNIVARQSVIESGENAGVVITSQWLHRKVEA